MWCVPKPLHIWSVALAIVLRQSGIMEALSWASPNSNSSITGGQGKIAKDGVSRDSSVKSTLDDLLPYPRHRTQARQAAQLARVKAGSDCWSPGTEVCLEHEADWESFGRWRCLCWLFTVVFLRHWRCLFCFPVTSGRRNGPAVWWLLVGVENCAKTWNSLHVCYFCRWC